MQNTNMGKNNNVRDFFVDFAEAIRMKIKEKNLKITPNDIPQIIDSADPTNFGRFSEEVTVAMSDGIAGIRTISFHPSVTDIANNSFRNLSKIENVIFPNNLKTIGQNAFQGCSSLKEINIPENVSFIGQDAFSGCTNIEDITIPQTLVLTETVGFNNTKWYNNQNDGVVYLGNNVLPYKGTMPENTSIDIQEGTLATVHSAFYNKPNLINITFPDTLYRFGVASFYNCGIKKIEILGTKVKIEHSGFANCKNLEEVFIKELDNLGANSFGGCSNLKKITIMNTQRLPVLGIEDFKDVSDDFTIYVANEQMKSELMKTSLNKYNIQIVDTE